MVKMFSLYQAVIKNSTSILTFQTITNYKHYKRDLFIITILTFQFCKLFGLI